MRAIDEIEDHRALAPASRARALRGVARALEASPGDAAPSSLAGLLANPTYPEVTRRLGEWLDLAPAPIRGRIVEATATMASRMADWVEAGFRIEHEADLDRYTYAVAGAVGLLLADLWQWWDGTTTDRALAIGFGRGLQAVNVARNRVEDLDAGVDFVPPGWSDRDVFAYARKHLALADRYCESLRPGPIREFCAIPLLLAHGSLAAMEQGRGKLTRSEVEAIVARVAGATAT